MNDCKGKLIRSAATSDMPKVNHKPIKRPRNVWRPLDQLIPSATIDVATSASPPFQSLNHPSAQKDCVSSKTVRIEDTTVHHAPPLGNNSVQESMTPVLQEDCTAKINVNTCLFNQASTSEVPFDQHVSGSTALVSQIPAVRRDCVLGKDPISCPALPARSSSEAPSGFLEGSSGQIIPLLLGTLVSSGELPSVQRIAPLPELAIVEIHSLPKQSHSLLTLSEPPVIQSLDQAKKQISDLVSARQAIATNAAIENSRMLLIDPPGVKTRSMSRTGSSGSLPLAKV